MQLPWGLTCVGGALMGWLSVSISLRVCFHCYCAFADLEALEAGHRYRRNGAKSMGNNYSSEIHSSPPAANAFDAS